MTKRQVNILIIISLSILILINLSYMPGPNILYGPAQLLHTIGLFGGLVGVVGLPFGLYWLAYSKYKKRDLFRPLLFTVLFGIPFISLLLLTNLLRDGSRYIAIKQGNKLITQIEDYKTKYGVYPEYLDTLKFDIPYSMIIGIKQYKYTKTATNFELTFYQNVLMNFNFEIVTYNNRKEHTAKGELKKMYETFDDNWRYYIFD